MAMNGIIKRLTDFTEANHYIDVADKVPIFACSIGAHIFNAINKCSRCDFMPSNPDFSIPNCPLRHENPPIYTPMSQLADTRIHILMRGEKGSGKSMLINMFLAEGTGLLYSKEAFESGLGFRTMMGPNSITEAGMFGSVDEEGNIVGRPLARDMCGGFLGFEESSSLTDANKKDHSTDMKNQLLTSLDNGRVQKAMRSGWVQYNTRYTMWGGTQPARLEMESGLDRRFFIIDIEMTADKEMEYKKAQQRQANMTKEQRVALANESYYIREWFSTRMYEAIMDPPTGVYFDDSIAEWIERPEVRSFEADLFRRLAIGYTMLMDKWEGGKAMVVKMDEHLHSLLESSLIMRRSVMDADVRLVKDSYWMQDITKSTLLKEVSRIITKGDYTAAKRWIDDNLVPQIWYHEYTPSSKGRGRKGVVCRIGPTTDPEQTKQKWGAINES